MAEQEVTPQPDENKENINSTNAVEKTSASPLSSPSKQSPKEPAEDKFDVRLNSYKIVSALGVTAVHNEIAFYKNGKPLLAFNGNAHNSQTGDYQSFAVGAGNTLRVSASLNTIAEVEGAMEQINSVTLAHLKGEDVIDKIHAAVSAGKFINENKIDYVVVGGATYEAQNSNSVAAALVHAMGYEYPEKELSHLWAPGSKRNLLPDDWKANNYSLNLIRDAETLNPQIVQKTVKDEKHPNVQTPSNRGAFPNLFDPNTTTIPYVKKGHETELFSKDTALEEPTTSDDTDSSPADETTEEEPEEYNNPSAGFQSSAETIIRTNQNLTASFADASAKKPIQSNPDMGLEINDPALKQKVASNATSYLSTANSLA